MTYLSGVFRAERSKHDEKRKAALYIGEGSAHRPFWIFDPTSVLRTWGQSQIRKGLWADPSPIHKRKQSPAEEVSAPGSKCIKVKNGKI
jgi:hypothetical protein